MRLPELLLVTGMAMVFVGVAVDAIMRLFDLLAPGALR